LERGTEEPANTDRGRTQKEGKTDTKREGKEERKRRTKKRGKSERDRNNKLSIVLSPPSATGKKERRVKRKEREERNRLLCVLSHV